MVQLFQKENEIGLFTKEGHQVLHEDVNSVGKSVCLIFPHKTDVLSAIKVEIKNKEAYIPKQANAFIISDSKSFLASRWGYCKVYAVQFYVLEEIRD